MSGGYAQLAHATAATHPAEPGVREVAVRVLRRAARKSALSPTTWIVASVALCLAIVLTAYDHRMPLALAAPPQDAADQYVHAPQSGDVDTFLASLSPEARAQLGTLGGARGIPAPQLERRAARIVLAQDHVDRYTRLGQHSAEDGSFVVYAVERDAPDGTHTTPLVVWLDSEGHVAHSSF